MSNPSEGEMWADIVRFLVALIPMILSVLCLGTAALLFVVHDVTPVVERLVTVGAIMMGISCVFGFSNLVHNSDTLVEEDEDVVDN